MEQSENNYVLNEGGRKPKRLVFGTSENIFNTPSEPITIPSLGRMRTSLTGQNGMFGYGEISANDYAAEIVRPGKIISKEQVYGNSTSKYDKDVDYMLANVYGVEATRGMNQSNTDKWFNAGAKFGITTLSTAADIIAGDIFGVGQGLYKIIFDRDGKSGWEAFVDGFLNNEISKLAFQAKEWGNEQFTNYYTGTNQFKKEHGSFAESLSTANFWADDVFVNIGYTAGIGLGLMAGKMMSVKALSNISKFGKSADVIENAAKTMKRAGEAENLAKANSRLIRGSVTQSTNLSADLVSSAKNSNLLNKFVNPASSFAAASSEARMESIDLADKLNNATDEYMRSPMGDHGFSAQAFNNVMKLNNIDEQASSDAQMLKMQLNTLTPEMLEQLNSEKEKIKDEFKKGALEANLKAQLGVYIGNFPILLATNAVMYGKGLIRSTGKYGSASSNLSKALGITAKDSGKFAGSIKGSLKTGVNLKWHAKKLPQIGGRMLEKITSEGLEEISQQWVSDINELRFKDYMNDLSMDLTGYKYAPEVNELGDAIFTNIANAVVRTFNNTFTNKETWLQGFTGAFTGLFGIRPHMSNISKRINKKGKVHFWDMVDGGFIEAIKDGNLHANTARDIVANLNPVIEKIDGNFINYLGSHYMMEGQKQQAYEAGNIQELKDLTLKQVVNDLMLFQEAGMHDTYIDNIKNAAKVATEYKNSPEKSMKHIDEIVESIRDTMGDKVKNISRDELFDDYVNSMNYVANSVDAFIKIKSSVESLLGNYKNEDLVNEITYKHFMATDWANRNKELNNNAIFRHDVISVVKSLNNLVGNEVNIVKKIETDLGITIDENIGNNDFSKLIDYLIVGKSSDNVTEDFIKKVREKHQEHIGNMTNNANNAAKTTPTTVTERLKEKLPLFFTVLENMPTPESVEQLQEYISNLSKIADYRAQLSKNSLLSNLQRDEFNFALMDIDKSIDDAITANDVIKNIQQAGGAANASAKRVSNLNPEDEDHTKIYRSLKDEHRKLTITLSLGGLTEEGKAELQKQFQRLGIYIQIWNTVNNFRNELLEGTDGVGNEVTNNALSTLRLIDARVKSMTVFDEGVGLWFKYLSGDTTQEEVDKLLPTIKDVSATGINSIFANKLIAPKINNILENYLNADKGDEKSSETGDDYEETLDLDGAPTKESVVRKPAPKPATKKQINNAKNNNTTEAKNVQSVTDALQPERYLAVKNGDVFKSEITGNPAGKNTHFKITNVSSDGKSAEFEFISDNIMAAVKDVDTTFNYVGTVLKQTHKSIKTAVVTTVENGKIEKVSKNGKSYWKVVKPIVVEISDISEKGESVDSTKRVEKQDELVDNTKKAVEEINSLSVEEQLVQHLIDSGIEVELADGLRETANAQMQVNAGEMELELVNAQFNRDLERQVGGLLPKGHVYNLGTSSVKLLSTGIPNLEIKFSSRILFDKTIQKEYPFNIEILKNLPKSIQHPIAIFKSSTWDDRFLILIEHEHINNGIIENMVVALAVNREYDGLMVNDIRSVYPRENIKILKAINDGDALYIDKNKITTWFNKRQSNSAEVINPNGNDYANIQTTSETTKRKRKRIDELSVEEQLFRESLDEATRKVNEFVNPTIESTTKKRGYQSLLDASDEEGIIRRSELTPIADETVRDILEYNKFYKAKKLIEERGSRNVRKGTLDNYNNSKFKDVKNPVLSLGKPTEILQGVGISNENIEISFEHFQEHIIENLNHDLTAKDVAQIMRGIHNPLAIYKNVENKAYRTTNQFEILTSLKNRHGDNIIFILKTDHAVFDGKDFVTGKPTYKFVNRIVTGFAKDHLRRLNHAIDTNGLLFINRKRLAESVIGGSPNTSIATYGSANLKDDSYFGGNSDFSVVDLKDSNVNERASIGRETSSAFNDLTVFKNAGTNLQEIFDKSRHFKNFNNTQQVQFLITVTNEVLGYVKDGKIYLDKNRLNPNTPIHEYTHLWDSVLQQVNPTLWAKGVELMKQTFDWDIIANSMQYGKKWEQEGKTGVLLENLIASEVHARFLGNEASATLKKLAEEQGGNSIIAKLKQWLLDVYKSVASMFDTWSSEAIDALTLDTFNMMPLKDFVEGGLSKHLALINEQVKKDNNRGGIQSKVTSSKLKPTVPQNNIKSVVKQKPSAKSQVSIIKNLDSLISKQGGVHVVNSAGLVDNFSNNGTRTINSVIPASINEGATPKASSTFNQGQVDAVNNTNNYLKKKGAYVRLNDGSITKDMPVYIGFNREVANMSYVDGSGTPSYYMAVYVKIDGEYKILNVFNHSKLSETLPGIVEFFKPFVASLNPVNDFGQLYSAYNEVVIDSPVGTVEGFEFPKGFTREHRLIVDNKKSNKVLYKSPENEDSSIEPVEFFNIDNPDSYSIVLVNGASDNLTEICTHIAGKSVKSSELSDEIISSFGSEINKGQTALLIWDKALNKYRLRYLDVHTLNSIPDIAGKIDAIKRFAADAIFEEVENFITNTNFTTKEIPVINKKDSSVSFKSVTQPLYHNFANQKNSQLGKFLYLRFSKKDVFVKDETANDEDDVFLKSIDNSDNNNPSTPSQPAEHRKYSSDPMYNIVLKKGIFGDIQLLIYYRDEHGVVSKIKSVPLGKGLAIREEVDSIDLFPEDAVDISPDNFDVTERTNSMVNAIVDAIFTPEMDVKFNLGVTADVNLIKQLSDFGIITTDLVTTKNPYTKTVINVSSEHDKIVSLTSEQAIDNVRKQESSATNVIEKVVNKEKKTSTQKSEKDSGKVDSEKGTRSVVEEKSVANDKGVNSEERAELKDTRENIMKRVTMFLKTSNDVKTYLHNGIVTEDELREAVYDIMQAKEFKELNRDAQSTYILDKLNQKYVVCGNNL